MQLKKNKIIVTIKKELYNFHFFRNPHKRKKNFNKWLWKTDHETPSFWGLFLELTFHL